MYADMKTVRPGDMIFVHAGQKIYGAFKAESHFMEDSSAPGIYLSKNIHYNPTPGRPGSGWKNVTSLPAIGPYRKVAISHWVDARGRNLCYPEGFDSTEIFDLKSEKKLFSVPERWKYTDAARTVRPLFAFEAQELLHLLQRANSDVTKRLTVAPTSLTGYSPIVLVLDPHLANDEKIVEATLVENLGLGGPLDNLVGPVDSFGNNVPSGYLKFIDILGYAEFDQNARKFRVIEVKKDELVFPDEVRQLVGYLDWATVSIAKGDHRNVEGILVALGFSDECKTFVTNYNTVNTGRKIKLVRFEYDPPNYQKLNFHPA